MFHCAISRRFAAASILLALAAMTFAAMAYASMSPLLQVPKCPIHPYNYGIFKRYDFIGGVQVKVYECANGPHEFVVRN